MKLLTFDIISQLGDFIGLIFSLITTIIILSLLKRVKKDLKEGFTYFLIGFVFYSIIKIIKIINGAFGYPLISTIVSFLLNTLFLVLILIGLYKLLDVIKMVNGEKTFNKKET